MEGGFIPIPDHRIPPQVSYKQMLHYINRDKLFEALFKKLAE